MKLSEELKWRGFLNQTTFTSIDDIDKKKWVFYHGIDASADSLTIGNLAALMLVKLLVRHGNRAILLAGGATSMIGDPGGKDTERPIQDSATIEANIAKIERQMKRLFTGETKFVNNLSWHQNMGVLAFLRDIGKNFSVTSLIQRDYIAKRLGEGGSGISFAELSYTLLQGYDYYHLYKQFGTELQISGADQWGNILSGVDLIRRVAGKEVHGLTMPLIINTETGIKFGKSEAGAIWLDSAKTTPTQFYQFWINTSDRDAANYLKLFTTLSKDQISKIMTLHQENLGRRVAQTALAQSITKMVHGEEHVKVAELITDIITGQQSLSEVEPPVLHALRKEIPTVKSPLNASIVDLLVATGLASSNTDARRLLESGAIYINNEPTTKLNVEYSDFDKKLLLLRRGKAYKDSALIELE